MTGLEITLFILGTAFIIISFFIVDNSDKTPKDVATEALNADTLEQLRSDFVENSNREADIILRETEDKLENVSNDKIIAVGEYSDQVLEKINSNHKEVVFLYQMLNEKEEELKTEATKMDNMRIECEKMLKEAKEYKEAADESMAKAESVAQSVAKASEEVKTIAKTVAKPAQAPVKKPVSQSTEQKVAAPAQKTAPAQKASAAQTATASRPVAGVRTAASQTSATQPVKRPVAPKRNVQPATTAPLSLSSLPSGGDTSSQNRNDEIIALYKSGKSVMEISKLLGMGQGEVKLIIDLYC